MLRQIERKGMDEINRERRHEEGERDFNMGEGDDDKKRREFERGELDR